MLGEDIRVFLEDAITSANLERTLEGASSVTLSVHDPNHKLLRDKIRDERLDLRIDGMYFRLVEIDKAGPDFTLTFEDREVAYLRSYNGTSHPKKVLRDLVTRAEFVKRLVRTVEQQKIPVYIPELHRTQPIAKAASVSSSQSSSTPDQTDALGTAGLDRSADLTVKGVAANQGQMQAAESAMTSAVSYGATNEVLTGLIMALINETTITDPPGGLADSAGWLQLQASDHPGVDPHNLDTVVKIFVTEGFTGAGSALDLSNKYGTAEWVGKVMWMYNATTYPGAQYEAEARKWVEAFTGEGIPQSSKGDVSTKTVTSTKKYEFEVAKQETYWACIQRLAEEVRWRAFMSAGIFYYIDEMELFKSKPWAVLNQDTDGLLDFDFTYRHGRDVQQASATGFARDWAGPPGTVVRASEDDYGPGGGRYIVESISSDLFSDEVTFTLRKPLKPMSEPAPETVEKTVSTGDAGDLVDSGLTAGSGSEGEAILAPGADRPGVSTSEAVLDAVRQISAVFGEPLTITTGTNHSQLTTSGTVSQHWTGDAADIAMTGDRLTRLGQSALIAGGWSEAKAKATTGGLFNLDNGWQVIFNTNEGGDHYTHLHVGV